MDNLFIGLAIIYGIVLFVLIQKYICYFSFEGFGRVLVACLFGGFVLAYLTVILFAKAIGTIATIVGILMTGLLWISSLIALGYFGTLLYWLFKRTNPFTLSESEYQEKFSDEALAAATGMPGIIYSYTRKYVDLYHKSRNAFSALSTIAFCILVLLVMKVVM